MHAFHFGERGRELYGAHEAPAEPSPVAVVLCAAWGPEHLSGHQALRRLARVLVEEGMHAFRFDYAGTGDSAGDGSEVTLGSMVEDVEVAVEEAAALSQASEIHLVGLRLGGTVASLHASGSRDVTGAVLWDPVTDGDGYRAFLRRSAGGRVGEAWDVGGHLLGPEMQRELEELSLPSPPSRPWFRLGHGFVAEGSPVADLEDAGWTTEAYAEPPPWLEGADFGGTALPATTIARIARVVRDA